MAIVSFFETHIFAGTINTDASFSAQHNFAAPGLTVWSHPYLQGVSVNDDDGSVELSISQFKDKNGTHNGSRSGIFAEKCTSITFAMDTTDCIATALLTTYIFG
jgi:hypothetical protein